MARKDKLEYDLAVESGLVGMKPNGQPNITGAVTDNDVTAKSGVDNNPGPGNDPDTDLTGNSDVGTTVIDSGSRATSMPRTPRRSDGPDAGGTSAPTYSWDKNAGEKASLQLGSDILTAQTESLNSAQQLSQTAREYQTQNDMRGYVDAQNAEKVGWTGGYVLDQKRQSDYLKASIQAQMYGAMELQKYGYDSALAAARLSYDLNMKSYAEEYYNNAVNRALQEASITGTYVSAEYRDLISQYRTAKAEAESENEQERTRANEVMSSIKGWLDANGVSEAAFNAMATVMDGVQKSLEQKEYEYNVYNAAVQAGNTELEKNPSMRFAFNDDGTVKVDSNGVAVTINMDNLSVDDLKEYVKTQQGQDSYYSYVQGKLVGALQSDFTAWAKANKLVEYDSDGKVTKVADDFDYQFAKFLKSWDTMEEFDKVAEVNGAFADDWKFRITLPNGSVIRKSIKDLKEYKSDGKEREYITPQSGSRVTPEEALEKWSTFNWVNNGVPKGLDPDTFGKIAVKASYPNNGNQPIELEKAMRGYDWLKGQIKSGQIEDGTLIMTNAYRDSNSYLILYKEGKLYLMCDDDKSTEGSENYLRYLSYNGKKMLLQQ